ncbi:MAG: hypothetical protein JNM25_05130 [Planctomycetes bacterium]|nr:hypothetical protein [Planctomycetota bacterium]
MLPVASATARRRRAGLAAGLLLTACSALPPAHYPTFADHRFAADFVVPEGGRLSVPATTTDLVVQELTATPPPQRELFGRDGERWFVYPAGAEVRVVCRCRSYAPHDGQPLSPAQVLPGARHLEVLTAP